MDSQLCPKCGEAMRVEPCLSHNQEQYRCEKCEVLRLPSNFDSKALGLERDATPATRVLGGLKRHLKRVEAAKSLAAKIESYLGDKLVLVCDIKKKFRIDSRMIDLVVSHGNLRTVYRKDYKVTGIYLKRV